MLDHKRDLKAWIYLAIPLTILIVFTFYPIINTIMIAFASGFNDATNEFFVTDRYGVTHIAINFNAFVTIFNDRFFSTAITNTLIIVLFTVPITTILSLLIAVFLNSIKPLQKMFQLIFFLPYVTNTIALGMVFAAMFSSPMIIGGIPSGPQGLINDLFGLQINWVGTNAYRHHWMFAVILYSVWNGLAFRILVFVGGLQSIGKQYYDAAKIDATPPRRVLTKITIPLLSPILAYIIITSFIGAFQASDSVLAVAGGSGDVTGLVPADINRFTIIHFIYDRMNAGGHRIDGVSNYSVAAATSVILLLIILAATFVNLYISKKKVHF